MAAEHGFSSALLGSSSCSSKSSNRALGQEGAAMHCDNSSLGISLNEFSTSNSLEGACMPLVKPEPCL